MPCFQGLQYLALSFFGDFPEKRCVKRSPNLGLFLCECFLFALDEVLVVSKKKSSGIRNIWRWIRVYGRCLAQVVCVLLNFLDEDKGWLEESDMKFHLRHVYLLRFVSAKKCIGSHFVYLDLFVSGDSLCDLSAFWCLLFGFCSWRS